MTDDHNVEKNQSGYSNQLGKDGSKGDDIIFGDPYDDEDDDNDSAVDPNQIQSEYVYDENKAASKKGINILGDPCANKDDSEVLRNDPDSSDNSRATRKVKNRISRYDSNMYALPDSVDNREKGSLKTTDMTKNKVEPPLAWKIALSVSVGIMVLLLGAVAYLAVETIQEEPITQSPIKTETQNTRNTSKFPEFPTTNKSVVNEKTTNATRQEYFLTDNNALCSEITGFAVDVEADCKAAAQEIKKELTKANFTKNENVGDWPNGCYLHTYDDGVYFNKHLTGSSHVNARQICKTQICKTAFDCAYGYLCTLGVCHQHCQIMGLKSKNFWCKDQEGRKNICDGGKTDCIAKAKALCQGESNCHGFMWNGQWGKGYKGVITCRSLTLTEKTAKDWEIYLNRCKVDIGENRIYVNKNTTNFTNFQSTL